MKKEWTPHIIAITALVVFIVLGLACASEPPPRKFKPPMPLTQAPMLLNDPRMPPDRFDGKGRIEEYWRGTIGLEDSSVKPGFLRLDKKVYNVSIDETKIINYSGMVGLSPGKHTVRFSYKGRVNFNFNRSYVDVNTSNITLEVDIRSGVHYKIQTKVTDASINDYRMRTVHGWSNTNVNVSFEIAPMLKNASWEKPPAKKTGIAGYNPSFNLVYLEPYDSNVPVESQSFLDLEYSVYIVSFNGNKVSWGVGKDDIVTIGIPAGKHELQLANLDTNILYSMTIDVLPQHRYDISVSTAGEIVLVDQAVDKRFVATESGKFIRPK